MIPIIAESNNTKCIVYVIKISVLALYVVHLLHKDLLFLADVACS